MQHRPRWIRQFHKPNSPDHRPLLIFPHAGAGASAYRAFSKAFSANYDVIVFQYPGRQDRAHEPALTSLPEVAAGAFDEFRDSIFNRGVPITTFGHSMGALVSFEFVQLAEAAGIDVRQLTISAAVAPCRAANRRPTPQEDEQLLDHLAMLEGTSRDVFTNLEVMRMALPVIKSDHRAADAYSGAENVKIAARIHAICGDSDPIVTMADLNGWRKHSDDVDVTMFEGGHFYLNDQVDAIAQLLTPSAQHGRTA
ncbi:alpha/beta fold hydrolase [Nocardia sp. NBC_00565]|uniref:thioesterase II family protein n=1 Tax=Nocardia sp. NBC_00565 TaxID=2975993 RepID=UPI002E816DD6|nr:alpha/beta fold hydrolase [Nocardia sp. NBC_00565]WUC02824.1 alpha/beta fold hydrolase [Nocardia sp. NBC_00565]